MDESPKAGHYQRLRKRFLTGESGALSDEALLELLLSYSVGRRDVNPLAEELLRSFGSLSEVLAASPESLQKIPGMGESSVALLKVIDLVGSLSARSGGGETSAGSTPEERSREIELVAEEAPTEKPAEFRVPDGLRVSKRTEGRRKFQVCNGYLLEFEQLARVLHFLLENKGAKKISRASLQEGTGLADRQLESLVSMGVAMGLILPGRQILTPVGLLIAGNDIFIEKKGTLEWCHYVAAGSPRNLIWFEVFNHLLSQDSPMTQKGWCQQLRKALAGQYTDRTIGKHLHEEVRFLVDAYLERNLRKLELLHQTQDGLLYRRRYINFDPLVLAAMIYDFGTETETQLFQVSELATAPGSPAVVFGLDPTTFRNLIEGLHERSFVRYETTHNLDQIRLKPSLSAFELLSAHFEDRGLREETSPREGGVRR